MRAVAGPYRAPRVNLGLAVLLICSVVVGTLAGFGARLDLSSFFRVMVLANVLVLAYILLLKDLVAGILIYIYSLIFLSYYWRIIIPGLWPDLDVPRMMFIFIWLVFLLENLMGSRQMLPDTAIGKAMLMVMGAVVLSMLLSGKLMIRQFLDGYVTPFAMFLIAKNVFVDKRSVDKFIFWLAVPLALYFPVTAILEHYKVTTLLFPRYIGKAMVGDLEVNWGGRAMGTFIQPSVNGFAMIAMYVLASYILAKAKNHFARVYAVLISVITPIGVFFTYTRTVYLGYGIALVTLLVLSRRQRVTALVLVVAMALAVIGNWSRVTSSQREAGGVGEVSTAQTRVVLAQASLAMFRDHPLVGVGFTNFMEKSRPYIAQVRTTFLGYREAWMGISTNQHNQFFSVLTEMGLMGFVPFVLMYCFLFVGLIKAWGVAGTTYDPELLAAVWAVVAAYVTQIMFIEPRYFEFMNALPFMFVGIILGGYQRALVGIDITGKNRTNNLRKEYTT